MVRALLGCVAFLSLAAPAPQNSSDLRARYGEPDVQRFAIRPDITMAVEYGDDHKACVFQIQPRQAFIHDPLSGSQDSFSKETAFELLDEVAPSEIRGTERVPLFSGGFVSSCGGGTFGAYDNASVSAGLDYCKTPVGVRSLQVQFKRPGCDSLTRKK